MTKIEQVRQCASAGNWRGAIKIAAKFPRLGKEKAAIIGAWEAYARPEFQRQLGKSPNALISAGIESLKTKYNL